MGTEGCSVWQVISEPFTVVSLTPNLGVKEREGPAKYMFSRADRILVCPQGHIFVPTVKFRAPTTHL